MSSTESIAPLIVLNPHIASLSVDHYYHLGIDSSWNLEKAFGDVKFVLLCGSAVRAKEIAERVRAALHINIPIGLEITPIGKTERYSLYKIGPVIAVSHGMGKPSISILLHEITKLLSAAKVSDPIYIRIGTCGGLGVEGGTVIVSTGTVNGLLESTFPVVILGKTVHRPTSVDINLANSIFECRPDEKSPNYFPVTMGITMATDDFYEGQGRIDGAICEHTLEDKMAFLHKAHSVGVRNIEMESDCIVAFCTKLKIKCAVVCCAMLNRLKGDQVDAKPEQLKEYQNHAIDLVVAYVNKTLRITPSST